MRVRLYATHESAEGVIVCDTPQPAQTGQVYFASIISMLQFLGVVTTMTLVLSHQIYYYAKQKHPGCKKV